MKSISRLFFSQSLLTVLLTAGYGLSLIGDEINNGSNSTHPLMIFKPHAPVDFPVDRFNDVSGPTAKGLNAFLSNLDADSVYETDTDPENGAVIFRSYKSIDKATELPALRFQAIIKSNINLLSSMWFSNAERKQDWVQYCDKFNTIELLPQTVLTPTTLRWGQRDRFFGISPAPLFVWARSLITEVYFVRNTDPNDKWIAMLNHSITNQNEVKDLIKRAYHYDIDVYNTTNKHEMADMVISSAILKPISEDVTYLDFTLVINPKGNFPTWVVDLVQRGWPRNTYDQIRNIVADPNVSKKFKVHDFFSDSFDSKTLSSPVIP